MKITDFFGNTISEVLDSAKGIVTTFVKDKGLEQQITAELDKRVYELKQRQIDLLVEQMKADNADRADARSMTKDIIKSDDKFVRRFPMIFAAGILLVAVVMVLVMLFVAIPNDNRDIINFAIGSILGCLGTIATFFFGSSYYGKGGSE